MPNTTHPLLSRLTQMLPMGNAVEQVNAIIDRPDADLYIQTLEPDVLYQLIKQAGWDQGVDLIPFATPEQLQTFLDFDVWRRDHFIPARLDRWLAVITQDTTDAKFKKTLRELSPEVVAMYFKENLQVMDTDEGRIPDDAPDRAVLSPDGVYVLVYPEDDARQALMRRLVDRLYELDRVLAWTLFEAVRWELRSEMEEYALHWRTSRLEEFGFVSRSEAMQVYRPLDPLKLREKLDAGELSAVVTPRGRTTLDLPAVIAEELDSEFLFVRMLQRIEDNDKLQAKLFEVASLSNKVMVADGIEPGEVNSGRQVLRRMLGYLSLGLEFLSRTDEERALALLDHLAVREIFRAGFALVERLQRQAINLERRPTLTIIEGLPYSLLSDDDAALIESLQRQRPTFARDTVTHELFAHQEQVDQAALALGRVALKQLWLFAIQKLGVTSLADLASREDLMCEPIDITFDTLFATWLAHLMGSGQPSFEPLDRQALGAFLLALNERAWEKTSIEQYFSELIDAHAIYLVGGTKQLFIDWLDATLARMVDEFGRLQGSDDAIYILNVVLIKREA